MPSHPADPLDVEYHQWREQRKKLSRELLRNPAFRRDLEKLVTAGADRDLILQSLTVMPTEDLAWRRIMKRKIQDLKDVGSQVEQIANRAERCAVDQMTYIHSWLALLGLLGCTWDDVKTAKELSPPFLFAYMRSYATNCRKRARALGRISRKFSPELKRRWLTALLNHVSQTTGKSFDSEIARLLQDAYEAEGLKKTFSADQLKKHRQRWCRQSKTFRKLQCEATLGALGLLPAFQLPTGTIRNQ